MDDFHERLARVGLAAGGRYGLALAGGYAVQAAGLLERLSDDVDAAITSGRYSRGQLITLAENSDNGFDRRMFADALGRAAVITTEQFAAYGVTGDPLAELRARFADWRVELLADSSAGG